MIGIRQYGMEAFRCRSSHRYEIYRPFRPVPDWNSYAWAQDRRRVGGCVHRCYVGVKAVQKNPIPTNIIFYIMTLFLIIPVFNQDMKV
jgi:hypothetical protein